MNETDYPGVPSGLTYETETLKPSALWDIELYEDNPTREAQIRLSLICLTQYKKAIARFLGPLETTHVPESTYKIPNFFAVRFGKSLEAIEEQLALNNEVIKQIGGDLKEALITDWGRAMRRDGKDRFLKEASDRKDELTLNQPSPGLLIFSASPKYYEFLQRHKAIPENSAALFTHRSEYFPSYVLVSTPGIPLNQQYLQHEVSHFIFGALEDKGIISPPSRSSKNLLEAFQRFRNELIAYIAADMDLEHYVSLHGHKAFIYYGDDEQITWTETTLTFVQNCIKAAQKTGSDQGIYLYPAMKSRNFQELMLNFSKVTKWSI